MQRKSTVPINHWQVINSWSWKVKMHLASCNFGRPLSRIVWHAIIRNINTGINAHTRLLVFFIRDLLISEIIRQILWRTKLCGGMKLVFSDGVAITCLVIWRFLVRKWVYSSWLWTVGIKTKLYKSYNFINFKKRDTLVFQLYTFSFIYVCTLFVN